MTKKAIWILLIVFSVSFLIGFFLLIQNNGISKKTSVAKTFSLAGKVGLIKVEGVIENSASVIKKLKDMRDDPSISAYVLRIESPGGNVAAAQEIYEEVKKFRDQGRNLVVSMGNVAASGGYYIACPAQTIFANPGTITGSIGVIFQVPYTEELFKKIGVGEESVKSGVFKDAGSLTRRLTADEKKMLQGVVNDSYDQFLEAIEDGRDITRDELLPIADGRIFTGRQAYKYGLVDTLGTLEDAISYAAKISGIRGIPKVVEPPKSDRINLRDLLSESVLGIFSNLTRPVARPALLRYQME